MYMKLSRKCDVIMQRWQNFNRYVVVTMVVGGQLQIILLCQIEFTHLLELIMI